MRHKKLGQFAHTHAFKRTLGPANREYTAFTCVYPAVQRFAGILYSANGETVFGKVYQGLPLFVAGVAPKDYAAGRCKLYPPRCAVNRAFNGGERLVNCLLYTSDAADD